MLSTNKHRVRVQQQNIYTAEGQIKFRLFWNRYSDRVATFSSIENPYQWENGFCTYLGFPTKAVALAWQQHLLRIGVATSAEYRKVNRLKVDKPKNCAIRWELKVRGLTYRQLLHLLTFDLTQVPPQPERRITAHDFEVCDRVKIINTYGGAEDSRIGLLGTVESRDVRTNTVEVRVDSQKVGTLLLKPEWAVKVDAVEFPNCCELPEPQSEQSETAEQKVLTVFTTHWLWRGYVNGDVVFQASPQEGWELLTEKINQGWKIVWGDDVCPVRVAQPVPEASDVAAEVECSNTEKSLAVEMPIFEVGDRAEVISNRHGEELLEVVGIISAASKVGAVINVQGQLRWFCDDELRLIEKAPQPRQAKDDLFAPVEQEYTTPQLPLNYNAAPVGRRGATANWKARQASGRGVRLTSDDGMEKWRQIEQQQKLAVALATLPDDDDDGLPF